MMYIAKKSEEDVLSVSFENLFLFNFFSICLRCDAILYVNMSLLSSFISKYSRRRNIFLNYSGKNIFQTFYDTFDIDADFL